MEPGHTQLDAIRSTLMSAVGVDDCAAVWRRTVDGVIEITAYVAGPGALATRELAALAARAASGISVSIIPVSAIPLTADGLPDFECLATFPVLDERSLQEWTRQSSLRFIVRPRVQISEECQPLMHTLSAVNPSEALVSLSGAPAVAHGPDLITEGLPPTLPQVLRRNADQFANHWLMCFRNDGTEVRISWDELAWRAGRVLHGLHANGVCPGDKVALQCEELDETLVAFWACQIGGFVAVPAAVASSVIGSSGGTGKLLGIYRKLGSSLIIASTAFCPALNCWLKEQSIPARVMSFDDLNLAECDENWFESDPDALALILFTSGSTGTPKGVQHTHRTLISHGAANAQVHGFSNTEIQVNWFPLDHIGGIEMAHLQGALLGTCQVHVPSEQILRDPLLWIDLVDRFRATWTWAPNFAFGLVNDRIQECERNGSLNRRWDLSRMGFVLNGGEAVVARTARTFLRLLAPFGLRPEVMRPAWGMSETCSGVAFSGGIRPDRDDASFVEVGLPVAGTAMRIVDSEGKVVQEGVRGRLQVRGCSITTGYFENPEANTSSFTDDGWFETGDLATLVDGRLTITGRSKDVVIINGVNFYSHEIESAVDELPGIDSSYTAACGVREAGDQTERLCIFFHPLDNEPSKLQQIARLIRAKVREHTGAVPHFVIPMEREEIPKTNIGKIQRAQLKSGFEAGQFRGRTISDCGERTGIYSWKRIPYNLSGEIVLRAKKVLIAGGEPALVEVLQQDLTAYGAICVQTPMTTSLSVQIRREEPDVVLYLRCSQMRAKWEPLLDDLNALRAASIQHEMRLFVVTHLDADGELGAVSGLLHSFAASTGIQSVHILMNMEDDIAVKSIIEELAAKGGRTDAVWRQGERLVPSLVPVTPVMGEGIRHDGMYLVTGGLGGIGLRLSRYLLERYQARVLIIGRRNIAACRAELRELQQAGREFLYLTADAADLAAIEDALQQAEAHWHCGLDGIFHLAGELGAENGVSRAALANLIRTKAEGAAVLGQIVQERPRARLVLFSSVNGLLGSSSLWGYSAANSAMDRVAERLAETGLRVQTINWSSWEGPGMGAQTTTAAWEASRALGYQSLNDQSGIEALEICLRLEEQHLVVGLDGTHARMRSLVRVNAQSLEELTISGTRGQCPSLEVVDRFGVGVQAIESEVEGDELAKVGQPSMNDIEQEIASLIGELLRVTRVCRDDSFFLLGGDSLAAVRLLNRIEQRWGVRIALRAMAENATTAGLAVLLERALAAKGPMIRNEEFGVTDSKQLLADLDSLDDSEVKALLAQFAAAND